MNLEEQLREAFAPCEPGPAAEAAVMAYVFGGARRAPRGQRDRRILVGTVLVVAAAASMLVVQLRGNPAHDAAVTKQVAPAISAPVGVFAPAGLAPGSEPVAATNSAMAPVVAEPPPPPKKAAAGTPIAVKPFTVQMQPLKNNATDVDAKAAIDLYYTALLTGLRAIPGLRLVELETPQPNEVNPVALLRRPDEPFRFAVTGGAGLQPGKVSLQTLEGATDTPDGRPGGARFAMTTTIDIVPSCANSPGNGAERISCNDPASAAATLVDFLRTRIFPPDPSLTQYLLTRVADVRLDPNQRLKALSDLSSVNVQAGRPKLDDAAIRGAIDLAVKSPDPVLRARVWQAMRGVRHADLLQPLLSAARDDPDGDARLQAVETLAADFAESERVHAALQTIAREDSRPMVRALAQRGLTGESAWKDYVVSSLRDTNRSIAERMEALMYYMNKPNPDGRSSTPMNPREVFDDKVVQALGKALPQTIEATEVKRTLEQLLGSLTEAATPDADSLLADVLQQSGNAGLRSTVIARLTRRASEPRVYSILQKASDDNDPQVRQAAIRALAAATPPSN